MPTYEYECRHCRHKFEVFRSIKEEPLDKCPKCGKSVRRLFGGGMSIIFKGSGFYTTDNKRSSASTGGNGSSKLRESEGSEAKPSPEKKETPAKK